MPLVADESIGPAIARKGTSRIPMVAQHTSGDTRRRVGRSSSLYLFRCFVSLPIRRS